MKQDLDERVRELLHKRRGDWKAVADGSGVSYSWLSKFANGHITNPGYSTLRKLESFLKLAAKAAPSSPAPAREAPVMRATKSVYEERNEETRRALERAIGASTRDGSSNTREQKS